MGNKESKKKTESTSMHLELNKDCFAAGETIKGLIHLNIVEKMYPSKVVYLEILGKELTKWVTSEGRGSKRHKSKHEGKNDILISKSVIQAFPKGEASPGQYSFPFSF